MTRTLQKRFIVTAMTAVTVLLLALLGVLNVVNAASNANESERLLRMLSNSNALFDAPPELGPEDRGAPPDDAPKAQPDGENPRGGDPGRGGLFSGNLTENDARSAVYFTVRFSSDGSTSADVSRMSDLDAETAIALAQPLYEAGSESGQTGSYRYLRGTQDGDVLYVFLDSSSRGAAVLRVALLSLLLGVTAWGLMLLLVILLSKRAIRPIAENMEKQRRFVTDAGHEIKTPLAIIQANTEAMELRTGETKYTKNIREQVGRLGGLMQDLLTLAKADETRTAETATQFSFSELVEQTAESFQTPMELRGLRLNAQIAPAITLKGDRSLLTRLVSILMDNAVKYASENSALDLSLTKTDRFAALRLTNVCDALPECEPEKLFDRFYRADEARTQKTGGYGIGLSAAQAIAQAHKGSLTAAYSDNNCITFTAKLPIK